MRSFLVFSYILKGKIGGPSAFNSLQGSRIFAGKNRSYIIDTRRKLTWSLEREILLRKSSVLGSRSTRIFWCHGWHHYLCWESWRKKGWTKVSNHWFSWNILWVEDQCDRAQETLKKGWRQAEEHQLIPLKWWNRWISPTWTQLNLLNHCIPSCHSNPPLFKWYPSVVEHCLWTFPGQPCMNPPPQRLKVRLPEWMKAGVLPGTHRDFQAVQGWLSLRNRWGVGEVHQLTYGHWNSTSWRCFLLLS